ncbi:hypothetical protein MBANPS3_003453 [Mucor bainieri]
MQSRTATRVIQDLLSVIWRNNKDSESNLLVETMRPFLKRLIIDKDDQLQFEWMTYRLFPLAGETQQLMIIPDLAIYVTLHNVNYELLLLETKKPGNYSNGSLEKDLVKLGKEMQAAIDKLIMVGVKNAQAAGIHIEGLKTTVYTMDLNFNGQYRMIKVSAFSFLRHNVNDILLVSSIILNMSRIKKVRSQFLFHDVA